MTVQILGLKYKSPIAFTLGQRLALRLGAPLITATVRALSCTCRHDCLGVEFWRRSQETRHRAIVAIWHESTTMAAYHYRNTGLHTLASYSYDAEWAARVLRNLGIQAVRGSSSNGGGQALRDLAVAMENGRTVLLTMDGPKGPRRVAKPGAAILAARTGAPIIPHAFAVRSAWRLRSWDRLSIAKPFARVICAYGPAIPPPKNTGPAAIEETRLLVEGGLNKLYHELEAAHGIEYG